MARSVSIRELHNSTSSDPWVPSSELRRIVREAPADPGLLDDLADVRGAEMTIEQSSRQAAGAFDAMTPGSPRRQ